MSIKTLFIDLQIYALFLIAGFLLREYVSVFRKLFLPASVLGGLVALIGSQQVLGIWTIPASFKQFSGELIVLIVATTVIGIKIEKKRFTAYVDYLCMTLFDRFGQTALGIFVGLLLHYYWKDLPAGWGMMAFASFMSGHGTAATFGSIMKELGCGTIYTDIGMILSTIGLVVAVVMGTVIVNIGVRRNQAAYLPADAALKSIYERGLVPKDQRGSLGSTVVYNSNVNNMAFQFAMLMIAIFIGRHLCVGLGKAVPFFKSLPNVLYGVIGAVIVTFVLHLFKADGYIERKTCNTLANFSMELLVLTSVSTLNLKVLGSYWIPIVIISIVIVAFVYFVCFWYNKRISEREWFEKSVYQFGNATGATPTAMLLLRMVDPENKSMVLEIAGAIGAPVRVFISWVPSVLPMMVVANPWLAVWMNLAIALAFYITGWVLFRKKVRALGR